MGAQVFKIQIISTLGIHTKYVEAHEFVVGRSEEADLRLQFPGVSRKHIQIAGREGHILIKDVNSKYGTKVNGKKIKSGEYVPYKSLDRIQFDHVPDVIITIRLVPQIEMAHLTEDQNKDFMKRLVKTSLSKAVSHWIQARSSDGDGSEGVITKKMIVEEAAALNNLVQLLTDAQSVASSIKNNSIRESENIIENAKVLAENIKLKAEDEGKSVLQQQNEVVSQFYNEHKQKIAEMEVSSKQEAGRILAAAQQSQSEIVQQATDQAASIITGAEKTKDEIIKKVHAEALAMANKQSDQILQKARIEEKQILENSYEDSKKLLSEAGKKAEKIINKASEQATIESDQILKRAALGAQELIDQASLERQTIEKKVFKLRDVLAELQNRADGLDASLESETKRIMEQANAEAARIGRKARASAAEIIERARRFAKTSFKALSSRINQQEDNFANEIKLKSTKLESEMVARREATEGEIEKAQIQWENEKLRLTLEVDELKETQSELQSESSSLERTISDQQKKKAELLAETSKLTEEAERIKIQSNVMRDELANIEQKKKDEFRVLSEKVQASQVALQDLARKQAETEQEVLRLETDLANSKQKKEELVSECGELQHRHTQLLSEIRNVEEESQIRAREVVERAGKEAERILAEAEEQVKTQELLAREEHKKREAEVVKKFKELQMAEESKLASMRIDGEKVLKAELEKKRFELTEKFSKEAQGILEHVKAEMNSFLVRSEFDETFKREVTERTLKVIDKALKGESLSEENKLQEMFQYNKSHEDARKKYWRRVGGLAVGLVATLAIFVSFKDEIYESLGDIKRDMASSKQDQFAEEYMRAQQEARKFKPILTDDFKATYTENVIYTNGYLDFEKNEDVRKRWILALNTFFEKSLGLDETTIVKFNSLEVQLLKNVENLSRDINPQHEKEAVSRILEAENGSVEKLKSLLGGDAAYSKFWAFKRDFFIRSRDGGPPAEARLIEPSAESTEDLKPKQSEKKKSKRKRSDKRELRSTATLRKSKTASRPEASEHSQDLDKENQELEDLESVLPGEDF